MDEIVLKAESRQVTGKQVKALRREGKLPAVIYGRKTKSIPILLDYREASRALPGISTSHLVAVDLAGKKHMALVREKQRHPVTGAYLHVDFQEVSMTEKIRTTVAIQLIGLAPAVKEFDGVLVMQQENLEVECLPADLPDHIEVDISGLQQIGDTLYIRDIELPSKIEVLTDPNDVIVVVTPPQVEPVEEEVVVEPAAPEPEVIEKGKKEEETF
jgi:large subunit ribosomal protein L25